MKFNELFMALVLLISAMIAPSLVIRSEKETVIGNEEIIDFEKKLQESSNYFITNQGQVPDGQVKFISSGGNAVFTPNGMLLRVREMEPLFENGTMKENPLDSILEGKPTSYHEWGVVIKLSFVDSNIMEPQGQNRCPWDTNYFIGSDPDGWQTEVPNYFEVVYHGIWDGIDLVYKIENGEIKYDLIVFPGGDPNDIQFEIEGHDSHYINDNSDLVIETENWDIIDTGLFAFQREMEEVECEFELRRSNIFGFSLSEYEKTEILVIDPLLSYSTFIGTDSQEIGKSICIDSAGNAYITGSTTRTSNFPTTSGAYDRTLAGYNDVFVTKLNSFGSSLIYSTYIGGSGWDEGLSICIDTSNNAYIAGFSEELSGDPDIDYPTTNGAYSTTLKGSMDVFITKLSSSGSSLIYSTFIGGDGYDWARDICIDSNNNAYITGFTANATIEYPTTAGAFDSNVDGDGDAFVTKLNSQGSSLIFSTFIGGTETDQGISICRDSSNNVYISGETENATSLFPTTIGSYNREHMGKTDIFVVKFNPGCSSLIYSTLIGGGEDDMVRDLCIDPVGNTYITGLTIISATQFPTTNGSFDTTHNGMGDVFITKINPTGTSILFSTLVGGGYDDWASSLCIDAYGNVIVTGCVVNSTILFPTTEGSYDTSHNGNYDVFILKLSPNGSTLLYSTFIGGSENDFVSSVCIDSKGFTYITGSSGTATTNYPTTNGAFDNTNDIWEDVFVTKLLLRSSNFKFESDSSNIYSATGDLFSFLISLNGTNGGEEVFVEYRFGTGPTNNISMDGSNPYSYNITIPSDSTDILNYKFHAKDTLDIWIHSISYERIVHDNDLPIFGADTSSTYCSTGDKFTFAIQVTDNIVVNDVYIEYWFENGIPQNASMEWSFFYSHSITIPNNSIDGLRYIFHAVDGSGNWIKTTQVNISVIDDDAPEWIIDETPTVATTGEEIEIMIQVIDNIGIDVVDLSLWFGIDGDKDKIEMTMNSDFYRYPVIISEFSVDPLWYHVSITDLSGLTSNYTERMVTILDDIDPTLEDIDDLTIYLGEEVNISIISNDNIGIISFEWMNTPIVAEENLLKGSPTKAGIFEITVTAYDLAGNSITRSFNLTILPEDHDTDGDGIPDLIEIKYGLSIHDPSDANDDLDNDGLTNLEEYINGTSLDDPDTDEDLMPDGWEIEHGLDPLLNTSTNDEDGDGKTDLDEYIEGSDPNISDSDPDEGKNPSIVMIIIIIIIVVIVILIGLALIIILKRKNIETEGDGSKDIENEEQPSKTEDEKAYEDLYGSP